MKTEDHFNYVKNIKVEIGSINGFSIGKTIQ